MPDRRTLLLTRQFQKRITNIGETAAVIVAGHWQRSGHEEADIASFTKKAQPALTAAKGASVAAAVAYYSTLVKARPPSVNARDVNVDLDPREPFIAYWRALKSGRPIEEANAAGIARAAAVARNLTVSASRRAGDVTLRKTGHKVSVWERVTDADACPWCEQVAQDIYRSAETADFGHDRCGCSAVPRID